MPLTVAIVLKPDFGSVFARALQRGIGTVVGAVAGAVLLVLVHGMWLLIPFAILATLLPYGRSRNYGLLSTFLTPLVVVLIDLLAPVAGSWPACAQSSSAPCPSRRRSAAARPHEEALKPVSEAIRALLGVLGPGQRLTLEG